MGNKKRKYLEKEIFRERTAISDWSSCTRNPMGYSRTDSNPVYSKPFIYTIAVRFFFHHNTGFQHLRFSLFICVCVEFMLNIEGVKRKFYKRGREKQRGTRTAGEERPTERRNVQPMCQELKEM